MTHYIYGWHTSFTLLQNSPDSVQGVYLVQGRHDRQTLAIEEIAHRQGIQVRRCPRAELDRMVSEAHQGIVLETKAKSKQQALSTYLRTLSHQPIILVLDQVKDPHNLGACLRSAEVFGADAVVVPKRNSPGLTPTVHKVASGAAEVMPLFQVTNLSRALEAMKSAGLWLLGLAEEAEPYLHEWDLNVGLALVLGSEEKGLRRLTREKCDALVAIPTQGQIASLNVAVAAGISLYEVVRQRVSNASST